MFERVSEQNTDPCASCPSDKKLKCWSHWGVCQKWIIWADAETARMNKDLENNPDFQRHMLKLAINEGLKRK